MSNRFFEWARQRLGARQREYQQLPEGVLADLAVFCGIWDDSTSVANISDARLRELYGRQQVFWRIWKHVNLSPAAFEAAYRNELEKRAELASRVQRTGDE